MNDYDYSNRKITIYALVKPAELLRHEGSGVTLYLLRSTVML